MVKRYDIKVTAKGFGESKGTIHRLGMSEEAARRYVDRMNHEDCYARWATYEVVEAAA